jgi:uncharacterized protein YyaL (SSP411 family)
MNRLADETSPYLRQHAGNPVEWYPWGEEALARARAEDKPILLSVGYSACHWCHVMAHESFEHGPTADVMNRLYVNIKVDREERPDIDDIYMQAVQALSNGRGGWPMTVFLLPDGRPFYAGTYYPREPRFGMPSFRQVLEGVHQAFSARRDECEEVAGQLTAGLARSSLGITSHSSLTVGLLDGTLAKFARDFDEIHGGFGGAPKFPQAMNLDYLLRHYAATGQQHALDMTLLTLQRMACGGIYDQIGGGFHRYSVDAIWLVPHFEKMLYDNAQLSRVYLHAWQITGEAFYRRIAEEIYDYVLREMTAPEGGFYSATDADSEGEEGRFFVWSRDELLDALGEDDAAIAIEYWGVTARGNFEGHNILYVPGDLETAAQRLGLTSDALNTRLDAIRDRLFALRANRIPPGLDDKILAAWNGLMLASLAEGARALDRADYREAAVRAGEFLSSVLVRDGRALRSYNHGAARISGFLEDYAALADAFLELYQTTFDERWFSAARALADAALAHFRAPDGGFFDTPDDGEALITRPRALQDNAVPSGSSLMARVLVRLAAFTGEAEYDQAARDTLGLLTAAMEQVPQAFGEALSATDMLVRGLREVAVIGDPALPATRALLDVLHRPYRPLVITALSPQDAGSTHTIPLLAARTHVLGAPAAYVCRQFACQLPVTTPDALEAQLRQ